MTYSLIFHIEALTEYNEATLWYGGVSEGLGLRFENAVERKLLQITTNPLAYAKKYRAYRQAPVQGFPFLIVYKVNESRHTMYVSAIFHISRNPKKKYRKF
jgi:hypothetical protein